MSVRTAVLIGLVLGLGFVKLGLYGPISAATMGLPVWWLER